MRGILLRPFTIGRLVAMICLAVACHFTPVEPVLTISATCLLLILARCSTRFERNIRLRLEIETIIETFIASVLDDPWLLADIAGPDEERPAPRRPRWPIRCWRWIVLEARNEREELNKSDTIRLVLYYLRAAPLSALIAVFCAFGSAAGLMTNPSNRQSSKTTTVQSGTQKGGSSTNTTPATSQTTESDGKRFTASVANESSPVATWDGECSNQLVQPGVSARAVLALNKLFDTESGLEPRQEGCVSHITTHYHGKEFYVSALGVDPVAGTHLSYALDSERYGPVMVLSAAAAAVKALVAQLGPVGGVGRFPNYGAGEDGDYYLLRTPRGIYALTRQHSDNQYLTLTPTVARAWLGAMNEAGEWLWPSETQGSDTTIQLSTGDPSDRRVAQITVDTTTGEAIRGKYRYPASPVKELSLTELQALAPTG